MTKEQRKMFEEVCDKIFDEEWSKIPDAIASGDDIQGQKCIALTSKEYAFMAPFFRFSWQQEYSIGGFQIIEDCAGWVQTTEDIEAGIAYVIPHDAAEFLRHFSKVKWAVLVSNQPYGIFRGER